MRKVGLTINAPVPEIIDPVFAKTSQNARFLLGENERFGLVFVKTGSINSGTIYTAPSVMLLIRAASITRASGRGLGPGNLDFFGPCEMASSR